jgi:chorismate mutase / prephenate dehydratase
VEQDVPNVTQFYSIGLRDTSHERHEKMTLIAKLVNKPGSLLDFLSPFKQNGINLSRILSRPLVGEPNAYVFLIDVTDTNKNPLLKAALKGARKACESMRCAGVYPINNRYKS